MKKKHFLSIAFCLMAAMIFTACNRQYPGYKQNPNGLYYRFYTKDHLAQQPKQTDFLRLVMACYLDDSLYYDWRQSGSDVFVQLSDSHFKGDLQEALRMMRVGDSASFYIKADSVAIHYYDQDPESVGLKPEDLFRYEVKLVEVKTQDEFKADIERMKEQRLQESKDVLAAYVKENGISVSPIESGIYLILTEKGKGNCPEKGDKVELDFEAKLLDGRSIGSTFGQDEKFTFIVGEGYVIPGWEVIVPKMHVGDRVTAIIPCEMAYGEHSVTGIPPYANLVYDIKLLKITPADVLKRQQEEEMQRKRASAEKAFTQYLKENRITEHTLTGLYYEKSVLTEGQGPEAGMTARIRFDAQYLDGTPLGNSEDLGGFYDIPFGQHSVLRGLEEGVGLMKVGEKARLVIPYTLAYGASSYGEIPPYSNFVFDVELVELIPENK
ncbi:MAG: FKBP-type peptidyl-prolyl cis-trans isomerase [Bacteroidales bacterium]|nr:FKBP-type peptidyl-prolyl cis-trans isomerase [Bacteroidales bacterium]